MGSTNLKYIQRKTVHGRTYHYFRAGTTYIRLRGEPGSARYHEHYALLLKGSAIKPARYQKGTVGALICEYRASPEFTTLADQTQYLYGQQLDRMKPVAPFLIEDVKRSHARALRDKFSKTPRSADELIKVMRILFGRAVDDEIIAANPAARFKKLAKGTSFRLWPIEALQAFEDGIKEGTVPTWAATAYMLGLHTAQARAEVLRMSRTHYDGTAIGLTRGKTRVELWVPVRTVLKVYLDNLPKTGLSFVCDTRGMPFKANRFSKMLRKVLDDHGLDSLHFHGLRHTTATAIAEEGGSELEIRSITGHKSSDSVEIYIKRARQKRLAKSAMARLDDSSIGKTLKSGGKT